jgi:hypothetical protein
MAILSKHDSKTATQIHYIGDEPFLPRKFRPTRSTVALGWIQLNHISSEHSLGLSNPANFTHPGSETNDSLFIPKAGG